MTFAATRRIFCALSASKMHLWSGLHPKPWSLQHSPDPPSWWRGAHCPSP